MSATNNISLMTTHELPCFTSEIQIHLSILHLFEAVKYRCHVTREISVSKSKSVSELLLRFRPFPIPWLCPLGLSLREAHIAIYSVGVGWCAHLTQVWSFILKFTMSWRIRSVNLCLTQLFKLNLPNSRGKKRPFRPVWDSWIAVISFRDKLSVQNDSSPENKQNKHTIPVHCSDREYGMSPKIKSCFKHCETCYLMTISTFKFPTVFQYGGQIVIASLHKYPVNAHASPFATSKIRSKIRTGRIRLANRVFYWKTASIILGYVCYCLLRIREKNSLKLISR